MHSIKHRSTAVAVLKRDSYQHTYADYLVWSRTHGDEVIDGTAYVREPPSPSVAHQVIAGKLYQQIEAVLENSPCRVFMAPLDVRLPKTGTADDQIDTVVQPDVLIVSDPQKIDARGVCGAPDWVAEVLSPGTARHDQTLKLKAYERAGVREVWFVHPVDRKLTIYRLKKGSYGRATVRWLKGKTTLTAVDGVVIDWDKVLARLL
jgi:Uma2 family endonuclease